MQMFEEFIRCNIDGCDGADFEEKSIVTIPNTARARIPSKIHEPLPTLERKIVYVCVKCGQPLNK